MIRTIGGPLILVLVSVLETSLGLDVIQDLLQLLILEATLQTGNTERGPDSNQRNHLLNIV